MSVFSVSFACKMADQQVKRRAWRDHHVSEFACCFVENKSILETWAPELVRCTKMQRALELPSVIAVIAAKYRRRSLAAVGGAVRNTIN